MADSNLYAAATDQANTQLQQLQQLQSLSKTESLGRTPEPAPKFCWPLHLSSRQTIRRLGLLVQDRCGAICAHGYRLACDDMTLTIANLSRQPWTDIRPRQPRPVKTKHMGMRTFTASPNEGQLMIGLAFRQQDPASTKWAVT